MRRRVRDPVSAGGHLHGWRARIRAVLFAGACALAIGLGPVLSDVRDGRPALRTTAIGAGHGSADAISVPRYRLPTTALSAAGPALDLPPAERRPYGHGASQGWRRARLRLPYVHALDESGARVKAVQLAQLAFAADLAAARAGLFSSRRTIPPPPFG